MPDLIPNPDPNIGFPPPTQPVESLFPSITPPPSSNTFEIGLVLGGTVSAAAYTAGVLDFLIEALDNWTVAKGANDPAAPQHMVIIKIVAGTSGGGVTAVLLARALASAFPHFGVSAPAAELASNPFYDLWVNQLDINDFLSTTDLEQGSTIPSLLCATKVDQATASVANYVGKPLGQLGSPLVRSYVEQLLPVVLTLTNMRGIPYSSDFKGTSKRPEFFIDHADHIRFLVDVTGVNPPATARPDEVAISAATGGVAQDWSLIAHAARGTSAFPGGFPAQTISRDVEHYRYRYAVLDTPGPPPRRKAFWLHPVWSDIIPIGNDNNSPYQFLAVDGGCINNEPIEFARTWLAGVNGHNNRDKSLAHRAVLLIDPFADQPEIGLIENPGLPGIPLPLVHTLVESGRFSTADLDLFTDEDSYSRFLVNPIRSDPSGGVWTGGDAIASSGLGAFMGFMCKAFRAHDFQLGRHNCQAFLQKHFVLGNDNSLFANWTPQQRQALETTEHLLPVIPVFGSAAAPQPLPTWPKGAFDPNTIDAALHQRLKKMLEKLDKDAVSGFFKLFIPMVNNKIAKAAADKFVLAAIDELKRANL